jgi:hypothetical protein
MKVIMEDGAITKHMYQLMHTTFLNLFRLPFPPINRECRIIRIEPPGLLEWRGAEENIRHKKSDNKGVWI